MSQISLVFDWAILRFPIIIDIWDFFRRLVHRRFEADYGQISAYLIHLTQESWSKRLGRKIPEEEAVQIIRSFRNFLLLLKEIKRNGK